MQQSLPYKYASLTPEQFAILRDKATEAPFTHHYEKLQGDGSFLCRGCGLALYRANAQFLSQCGWPSFDAEIKGNIRYQTDADGRRTEILCTRCDGHLGHIFSGEGYTDKNTRHCVNGLAIDFTSNQTVEDTHEMIFAGGCFWGLDYLFAQTEGVVITEVGYVGGETSQPSYEQVCSGTTGYIEAVRVVYDPLVISDEAITKLFFEFHDPTQRDGQGPDIGSQYLSAVPIYHPWQMELVTKCINQLQQKGFNIATQLLEPAVFWPAEAYHQDYYMKHDKLPYCHIHTKRF